MLIATNGPPRRRAVIVQRARHQFLAGAALAVDHHRQVGGREPRDGAVDLLHRRAAADQRQLLVGVARPAGGACGVGGRRGQRAADHREQFLQIERLGQILERAALRRLHRRHQRRLRAHHHDAQIGPDAADARDQIEAVLVRHHHVGDHQIALAVLHPAPQRRGVAGAAHLIARTAQRLGQHGADRTVVVGDQHGGRGHGSDSLRLVLHDRQMQAEFGAAGPAVDLDQAAMVADDLGDQRETRGRCRTVSRRRTARTDAAGCPRGCPARCRAPRPAAADAAAARCPAPPAACRAGSRWSARSRRSAGRWR